MATEVRLASSSPLLEWLGDTCPRPVITPNADSRLVPRSDTKSPVT